MTKRKKPINPEMAALVKEQEEAFRRKFGRDRGPDDPLLFNPDADEPRSLIDEGERRQIIEEMADTMEEAGFRPCAIYAFFKTGLIVTEQNYEHLDPADRQEWESALRQHQRKAARETKAIGLSFQMRAREQTAPPSREERIVLSEFTNVAFSALEAGVSSFALEGTFVNAWLIEAGKRMAMTVDAAQALRERLGGSMKEIRALLLDLDRELGPIHWTAAMRSHLAKIEGARAEPETWLGRPPISPRRAATEMDRALEWLGSALATCRDAGVAPAVLESSLLRAWLRMVVFNDRVPEEFFQRLDRHWPTVSDRVDSWVVCAVRPLLQ